MYFTQEDYKKIEDWLHKKAVKDTSYQEASMLTGNELLTLVQEGYNRKIRLKDFTNQLFNVNVEDFLNVSHSYDSYNITLKEAIRLIPYKTRKEGQIITFVNEKGNWEILQFKGSLPQWNNLTLWKNPFDWKELVINSILPDEEDLTISTPDANGVSHMSIKDKEYNPDAFSGYGTCIIRKNILDIEDPNYGMSTINFLPQKAFYKENTIYKIKYDFDLDGREIIMPKDCILEFEGGSIKNGTIIGNTTTVIAPPVKIFNNIVLKGRWNIDFSNPQWFGEPVFQKKGYLEDRPDVRKYDVPLGYMYLWAKTEEDAVVGGIVETGEVIPIYWNGEDWQDSLGNFVASGTINNEE